MLEFDMKLDPVALAQSSTQSNLFFPEIQLAIKDPSSLNIAYVLDPSVSRIRPIAKMRAIESWP
jgi:hypothetical protein